MQDRFDLPFCDSPLPSRCMDPAPTFRDPAGQLRLTAECALRKIRPAAADETKAFLASKLRASLERSGDLIPSSVAGPADHPGVAPGDFWLRHPRIEPISYPWEWTLRNGATRRSSRSASRASPLLRDGRLRMQRHSTSSLPARAQFLSMYCPLSAAISTPAFGLPMASLCAPSFCRWLLQDT